MKPCKHCGIKPSIYKNQVDSDRNTFHVLKCPRCFQSVVSFQSITNANKLWDKQNELTKREEFELELDKLINCYKQERRYLIEIFDELKIMTVEEFDEMNESLDEFDGVHPYIIKGRVI